VNRQNQEFGRERLEALIRQAEHMPLKEVVQKIRLSLEEFSEGKPLADDTTIVVSRIA
jgi:serine phosphatase RsbU (regulator of sigma subunit)